MRILPDPLAFQWDAGNINKNLSKHNVTMLEAEEMFTSKPFLTFEDEQHSLSEQRFKGLGVTRSGRTLFVAFTIRDRKIRVISIRDMKKKERLAYEQYKESA